MPATFALRIAIDPTLREELLSIPGVKVRGRSVSASDDVAWLLEQKFGVAPSSSRQASTVQCSGQPDAVRGWTKLYPYQQEDALAFARGERTALFGATGCLTGDALIPINRGGKGFRYTLRNLVAQLRGLPAFGSRSRKKLPAWDLSIPTMAQSVDEEGYVRLNQIDATAINGVAEVYTVETESGRVLRTTAEHKFLTPDGWAECRDLRVGGCVMAAEWPTGSGQRTKLRYKYVSGLHAHPHAVKFVPAGRMASVAKVAEHRLIAEARENRLSLAEFVGRIVLRQIEGLRFLDPREYEVHHRNGNTFDNRPDNLEVLAGQEHSALHGREGGWKRVAGRAVPDRVVRVERTGEEETFDLSMAGEGVRHSYVANDLIVHNTGKTPTLLAASALAEDGLVCVVTRAIGRESWARDAGWLGERKVGILLGRAEAGDAQAVEPELERALVIAREVAAETTRSDDFRAGLIAQLERLLQDVVHGRKGAMLRAANRRLERLRERGSKCAAYVSADDALADGCDVVVCGWETLSVLEPVVEQDKEGVSRTKMQARLRPDLRRSWSRVIFDEAHCAKGRLADRTAAAQELAKRSERAVWIATATPVRDRLRDLWAEWSLVDVDAAGTSWKWVHRYCLAPETPVLMYDGVYRPIGSLAVGDKVVGWSNDAKHSGHRMMRPAKVLNVWRYEDADRYEVALASGRTVICTGDHQWFTGRSEKHLAYRELLGGRALMQRLVEVAPGPRTDGADTSTVAESNAYQLGYIRGLLDGDGSTYSKPASGKSGPARQCRIGMKDREALERALAYGRALGMRPTGLHERKDGLYELRFLNKPAFNSLTAPRSKSADFRRGWLAGMYDAEGTCEVFAQYEAVNAAKCDFLAECLHAFGFGFKRTPKAIRVLGGRLELLRLWGLIRPALTRKIEHAWKRHPARMKPKPSEIVGIRLLRDGPVVSIETETGNYVANGYGSKNCHAKPGTYGGLDTSGPHPREKCPLCAERLDELKRRLDHFVRVRTRAELSGMLPPLTRVLLRVPSSKAAQAAGAGAARGARGVEGALAIAAEAKLPEAVELVTESLTGGLKVVVVGSRVAWAPRALKAIEKGISAGVRERLWSAIATGAIEPTERVALAREYMGRRGPALLVGTIDAIGEAIDLQDTDVAICTQLPYTYGQVVQFEGRFRRPGQVRPVTLYYLIAEGTIDEEIERLVLSKFAAIEEVKADTEGTIGTSWHRSDEEVIAGLQAWLREAHGLSAASEPSPEVEIG